ncbi:MAG: hypothetical protein HRT35_30050 [Algicola sp.]|nr:hypothetical protein [Algicola sp.]
MKRFLLKVAGMILLPLTLVGCGGGNKATDTTTNQTGNLSFTSVSIAGDAHAGYETTISFDITAETAKHNVYIKIDLEGIQQGDPQDLDISAEDYKADYHLTALMIDKMFAGETRHVEHIFTVPIDVLSGNYAAVFGINEYDFFPHDDTLQGEESHHLDDNMVIALDSITIVQPDKTNLRILDAELHNGNALDLSDHGDDHLIRNDAHFNLSLQLEAMVHDIEEQVDIVFTLEVPGLEAFPLYMVTDGTAGTTLEPLWSYQKKCHYTANYSMAELALEGTVGVNCASLFAGQPLGGTHNLYLDQSARETLNLLTTDTAAKLVIRVDPDNVIGDWQGNTDDDSLRLPVMLLTGGQALNRRPGPYKNVVFDKGVKRDMGNPDFFSVGYDLNAALSYATNGVIPYAGYFNAPNSLNVTVLTQDFNVLDVGMEMEFNADDIISSHWDWHVDVNGNRVYGTSVSFPTNDDGDIELWSSQVDGNEKYLKAPSISYTARFWVAIVPVSLTAGATGQVGIVGSAKLKPQNIVAISAGAKGQLDATITASVDAGVAAVGVGGQLTLIDLQQDLDISLQLRPGVGKADLTYKAPLTISGLNGHLFVYAEYDIYIASGRKQKDFLKWDGTQYGSFMLTEGDWHYPGQINAHYSLPETVASGLNP